MISSTPGTPSPAVNPTTLQLAQTRLRLEGQIRSGASWFYWIAGMSVINTVISMAGGGTSFVIGLGFTQVVSAVASILIKEGADPSLLNVLAFAINLAISAVFVVFGIFARKPRRWAFIAGIAIYLLDAVVFLLAQDWMSLIFHAIALYGLYSGFRAIGRLEKFDQTVAGAIAGQPPTITPV